MEKKIDKLLRFIFEENWSKALSLAASFSRLGEQEERIRLAHSANTNPAFYKQIGKNTDDLILDGILALKERYAKDISKKRD